MDRLKTVKALALYKFKKAMHEFGKPEVFRTVLGKAVSAKREAAMAEAVARAQAQAAPVPEPERGLVGRLFG